MGLLGTIAMHMDALVGPAVMLLYPLYASMRAIESPSSVDDQQWLTYWIIYSFITLFEMSCWTVLSWLPFWPYLKILAALWLVLPFFNGAAYIYENYARKYIKIGGDVSSDHTEGTKRVLQMVSLDTRKLVERYIEKYGPESFNKVVIVAEKEARRQRRA